MRAERVGSDTTLAQIVRMVGEAQRTRAPIQRLADAVAAWFVPAVVVVSIVAFVAWYVWGPEPRLALGCPQRHRRADHRLPVRARARHADGDHGRNGPRRAAGVLHQQCRSARAAREGRYACRRQDRDADGGQAARRPSSWPSLRSPRSTCSSSPPAWSRRASIRSRRPLSTAARARGLKRSAVSGFQSLTGLGVSGASRDARCWSAAPGCCGRSGIDAGGARAATRASATAGRSAIFVAIDGQPAGVMVVEDPIKPTTAEAIRAACTPKACAS